MNDIRHTVGILTLGCKVNQYESEALYEELERHGFIAADASDICDAYVVNTCTVTAEADRKSRQMIRRLHQHNPRAPIVVTGCTAQTSPEQTAAIEGVYAVVGNASKLTCADLLTGYFADTPDALPLPGPAMIRIPPLSDAVFEPMKLKSFPRTRLYIKIEDGCENRCAYCAIPGARGPVRSKRPEDVLAEVGDFCREGVKEIVLTGIETASYGRDLDGVTLEDLLRMTDGICGSCRIRLGSVDPSLFRQSFVDGIKDLHSLAPHFHISMQSGSSRVLAMMRRKYNADGARAALARLRSAIPDITFTTDIIVGFPGETEEDFEETRRFITEERFLMTHIFPYSGRKGTPAVRMPGQVPQEEKHRRAAVLAQDARKVRLELLNETAEKSPEQQVLFETFENGYVSGHTGSFIEVRAKSPVPLRGEIHTVRLTGADAEGCIGELAD